MINFNKSRPYQDAHEHGKADKGKLVFKYSDLMNHNFPLFESGENFELI